MSNLNIPNLDRLISHLEGLPEEKFDMRNLFSKNGNDTDLNTVPLHACGTAACIAGSIYYLIDQTLLCWSAEEAADWLGLCSGHEHALFTPPNWEVDGRYPLSRAIRTLKHMCSEYLSTGQVVVDWDAPEPEAKPAWTAPNAVEQTKPALPAEIVRFLRPADLEVVS